ncbi:hypothetical protein [Streptomyces sp. NPDC054863]
MNRRSRNDRGSRLRRSSSYRPHKRSTVKAQPPTPETPPAATPETPSTDPA